MATPHSHNNISLRYKSPWGTFLTEGAPRVSFSFYPLIVFRYNLEVSLRMRTNRANLRCFFSHMNVTAVAADPNNLSFFAEDLVFLYVFQKFQICSGKKNIQSIWKY